MLAQWCLQYYNTDYGTLTHGCKVRLYKLLTTQTQGQNIDTFVKTENDIISVYGTNSRLNLWSNPDQRTCQLILNKQLTCHFVVDGCELVAKACSGSSTYPSHSSVRLTSALPACLRATVCVWGGGGGARNIWYIRYCRRKRRTERKSALISPSSVNSAKMSTCLHLCLTT